VSCRTFGAVRKTWFRSDTERHSVVKRMSRRARRRRETLQRIEHAGWKLFTTRGYEATSTREIADAADIAAGTLFNYFPEKRSLLLHLMRREIDGALDDAFASLPSSTLEAQLVHVLEALGECCASERRLSRVFVKELLFTDGEQRTDSAAWTFDLVKRLAGLIEQAQSAGELDPDVDPLAAAQQVFSACYFSLVTWLGGTIPSRSAHRAQVRASLGLLLRGLRRRAA
jgi:AcrR family transcriptional regulator